MRVHDTDDLILMAYEGHDTWMLHKSAAGNWIDLRMPTHGHRHGDRFTILYTGPAGANPITEGGPIVAGPHGLLITQKPVRADSPLPNADLLDVEEGDVLTLRGQRLVIADDWPGEDPRLVTEAEWGAIVACRVVQDQINELQAEQHTCEQEGQDPDGIHALITRTKVNALIKARTAIRDRHDELRSRSAKWQVGDPDPTFTADYDYEFCAASLDNQQCTWPTSHNQSLHVAGNGQRVLAVWPVTPQD